MKTRYSNSMAPQSGREGSLPRPMKASEAYSSEPFYTGAFVIPHWEKLTEHASSLAAALSPVFLVLGLALLRWKMLPLPYPPVRR